MKNDTILKQIQNVKTSMLETFKLRYCNVSFLDKNVRFQTEI